MKPAVAVPRQVSRSFKRSVVTSIITTAIDFAVLMSLVELAGVDYVVATFVGSLVGATSNFLINRWWAFEATTGHVGWQAFRYALVQVGSSAIHTGGVWLFGRVLGAPYLVAKVVAATLAYLIWNYPMNHWFVFPAPAVVRVADRDRA